MPALKPKKTKLKIADVEYSLYRITPPKPKLEGVETTNLDCDTVTREPGDVLDMGETIEAELVYTPEIFAALQAMQIDARDNGTISTCAVVYADTTEDPFTAWVQEVGKSEAQVKGEPIKILLTLGIAGAVPAA